MRRVDADLPQEGARRRVKGGANRGFLNNLNEEDDDEEDEEAEAALAESKRKYGASVAQSLEQHRNTAPTRTAGNANQTYVGWGGADRKMAEAVLYDSGRAGTRDRGRANGKRGAGFELALDKATLLGRRNKGDTLAPASRAPIGSSPRTSMSSSDLR